MSPVRVTVLRTVGRMRSLYSSAFSVAGFLAAAAALFAFRLNDAEGGRLAVSSIWAMSVAPFLPALAAVLAMDVWSDERQSGRIEMLLSAPVRERDLTFGKFLGVFVATVVCIVLSFMTTLVALRISAPETLAGVGNFSFCPALFALMLQSALWCAVSVAASALFSHAATAACASLLMLVGVPRGGWAALIAWAPQGRTAFGEMPLDAQVLDMSSGLFSTGTLVSYLVLTAVFLFTASKAVAALRLAGRGAMSLRLSTLFAVLLSFVFTALAATLAHRLDLKLDIPFAAGGETFSARTRSILEEAHGNMTVTCFLPRSDARFREIGHFLRSLRSQSAALGGMDIELRYVDPHWDIGSSERLVRLGAKEGSVVFERGRRVAVLSLSDGFGERICASAILRLTMPPQRRNVYWTVGHGENSPSEYGSWGMSDIARDLARDGYRNVAIDLAGEEASIPSDCALIVVAGAKDDFSRAEIGRIDTYLRSGGRMLVFASNAESGGVASLMPGWGLRASSTSVAETRTISGTDVMVGEFSEHPITKPLEGSRILLERPLAFMPSAAAEAGAGADRIEFTALARSGSSVVAAVLERGAGAGSDLSIRPTRIVVVGDAGFVVNGQLGARANANRDCVLNCVAYLSGTDASVAGGAESGTLVVGMDRAQWMRFVVVTVGAVPFAVFVFSVLVALRRRRRS